MDKIKHTAWANGKFDKMSIELRFHQVQVKVSYEYGEWNCTCKEFKEQKSCTHTEQMHTALSRAHYMMLLLFYGPLK